MISVQRHRNYLRVTCPYHPDFRAAVRALGGKWDKGEWVFDARDERAVRDLLKQIFGTDGAPGETVTVRMRVPGDWAWEREIWAFGRKIVERRNRDWDVSPGEGVVIVEGRFPSWGGSRKNPSLANSAEDVEGIVLEVRDIPAGHPDLADVDAEIIDNTLTDEARVAELRAEREKLVARLAQLDDELFERSEKLTVAEAAQKLGVAATTVAARCRAGKLNARKIKGRWQIVL